MQALLAAMPAFFPVVHTSSRNVKTDELALQLGIIALTATDTLSSQHFFRLFFAPDTKHFAKI